MKLLSFLFNFKNDMRELVHSITLNREMYLIFRQFLVLEMEMGLRDILTFTGLVLHKHGDNTIKYMKEHTKDFYEKCCYE